MSAEWVTAIATAGTFAVIATSAAAALIQLRHMRSGNQIAAVMELRETMESAEFGARHREVVNDLPARLADPRIREKIQNESSLMTVEELASAAHVGNYFETAGALVRCRIVDADLFCELWSSVVTGTWAALEEFIANRRVYSGPGMWENFEYLTVLCEGWMARHKAAGQVFERKRLPDPWPASGRNETAHVG